MIVNSDLIPDQAKLWVYPSSRKLYPQEIPALKEQIEAFLTALNSGGVTLKCSYEIKYDRFIVVMIDDTECELDLEVHHELSEFILDLEKKYKILLMDKINVCYKQGEFVQYKDLVAFKKMIKSKGVSPKTIVFDNMITTKEALAYDWEINIMESWLSRFFK